VYTGREGLLIEFRFTPDGWIEFVKNSSVNDVALTSVSDNFRGKKLSDHWQWSVFESAHFRQSGGTLLLTANATAGGAYLGIKTTSGTYNATVEIKLKHTTAAAGIGAIGDDKNMVSVLFKDEILKVLQLKEGKETEIVQKTFGSKKRLYLQMQVTNGKDINFLYSTNNRDFQPLNLSSIDASFLPPWDRSVRAGLIVKGDSTQKAVFDKFQLYNK
jgi:hypothetical protein